MECELNGRLLKLEEDGELYYWNNISRCGEMKNPYWVKYKPTLLTDKRGKRYKTIKVIGRQFLIHRVIYFIHNYMEWDIYDNSQSNLIDHIDNNGLNNNIENLRPATHQQNMWNKKGKCYYKTKHNTYRAKVRAGEVGINKCFKTEQEAIDAVAEFKLKYHQF
mgnify:CR=1 FL=1